MPLLSFLVFFPIVSACIVLCFPSDKPKWVFAWGIFSGLVLLLVSYSLLQLPPNDQTWFLEESYPWIKLALSPAQFLISSYHLGVDGVSTLLVLLNAFIFLVAVVCATFKIDKIKAYMSLLLLLLGTVNGCFLSLDLLLFFVFFEFMLLPMYFLIGIWGGAKREYAAMKFILYTLLGSIFILLAFILVVIGTASTLGTNTFFSFDLIHLLGTLPFESLKSAWFGQVYLGLALQDWIFWFLILGFLIKLPAVPFHTWLPDAHVEAPTSISVVLAAVLLKIGAYGLYRIGFPMFPQVSLHYAPQMAFLGVLAILYAAYNALAQKDLKKMIAYSSISHMGFVLLGLSSFNAEGVNGAIFQMISHGLLSALLFLLVGVLYDRVHDRNVESFKGIAEKMPYYTAFTLLAFFASLGLPGFSGFIGEIFALLGAFKSIYYSSYWALAATFGLVLGAAYFLWALQRVFLGKFWSIHPMHLFTDLQAREWLLLAPLTLLSLLFGVCPNLLFDVFSPDVLIWLQGFHVSAKP